MEQVSSPARFVSFYFFFDKKEAQKKCEASFPIVSKELPFIYSNIEKEKFGKNISQWPREKKWFRLEKIDKKHLIVFILLLFCVLYNVLLSLFFTDNFFFSLYYQIFWNTRIRTRTWLDSFSRSITNY